VNALRSYNWPGNVRELRNVIERASIICPGEWVEPSHLGLDTRDDGGVARVGSDMTLENLEKAHIAAVLGNSPTLEQAATTLGIDVSTLYRKRKQYGL
jgi:NtrC-family two-component system response regulator AlgB